MYFTSNTAMVFLPGDHVLNVNVTVANVSRLTMHGESSSGNMATVVRNGSVGFSFTNMVDFTIYCLAFTSYNRSRGYGIHPASNSAMLLQSSLYSKLVNCSFHDNIGAALTVRNTSITLVENEFTHNQCACESLNEERALGCGITAVNSTLTFMGNTSFLENNQTASLLSDPFDCGGAVWASASSLHFNGTSSFIGNSANGKSVGGAILAETNSSLSFADTSNFVNNSADVGGAIFTYINVVLIFNGTNSFISNSASSYGGGAIYAHNSVITFNGTNSFISNSADNTSGGAIAAVSSTSLSFIGTSEFIHNLAHYEGGAIAAISHVVLTFNGTNNFSNNSANNGGAIFAVANISVSFTGTSSLRSNSAMQGGAISANFYSSLTLKGTISFTNNGHDIEKLTVSRGGAMYLAVLSTFSILPQTTVCWGNNYADLGGAIYILNANSFIYCTVTRVATFIPREKCFFQLPGQNPFSGIQFVFENNSANVAGSVLYGGTIDNCKLTGLDSNSSGDVFDLLFHIEDGNKTSSISSDPFRICLCENNHPDCSKSNSTLLVYPGEAFQVSVVAVGQRNGIVPAAVRSHMDKGTLLSSQYIQQTTKTCTLFNYTVFSLQDVYLELYADGSCSTFSDKLSLQLNITQNCPPGFNLQNSSMSCVCDKTLQKYTNHCIITNGVGQITRDTFWVGYDQSQGLVIVHPHCPFDYCVPYTVTFPLNSTLSDIQCAYNRSGLFCGACKTNYSLVLGTSHCTQCTNSHLALLIPFILMGVALVFLLLACKLTVATGTLSGLVFYANIVGVNRTIFLPVKSTDALSVFIAWINLDFGIETCFYDGMDAYSKTWLQFVFPVYIWVLVGLMVFVSQYSQRFANLLGNNPASVLATLILLSYAKILRTLIAVAYFVDLKYPENHYNRSVWLIDANVDYLVGKHIPLFLVAVLVFLFLFLPYTVLLLFGQWLQALSHLKLFSWVSSARLKPFMDSYHAPYKAKHRYWPGLLLVLRFVLLLVFALSPQQDPNINLLAIPLGTAMLQMWAWVSGGVYKSWCLDALEGSFALNLIVLAVATYHVSHSKENKLVVGYTSVSIALVTFIGILAFHIFQQLRYTKLWKKVSKLKLQFKKLNIKQTVDSTYNPLIDLTESERCDQLREPWLEDLLQSTPQ